MRNKLSLLCAVMCMSFMGHSLSAQAITNEIPVIQAPVPEGYIKVSDVAQYGAADWSNAIGIARGISLADAIAIAESNPEITFFFYTKGDQMVLKTADGSYRVFNRGDSVFFSGEPWWGSAPDLADGYIKE